jgi:hypothetical protein
MMTRLRKQYAAVLLAKKWMQRTSRLDKERRGAVVEDVQVGVKSASAH